MSEGDDEYDYVFRTFAPMMGIDEDPGTGIANCMCGHYWGEVLGKDKMQVGQLSERGSEFSVEVVEEGVRITGKATPLIKGTLKL
jgi:predicted PhzF superfamily epimerase YddE/YHI9